MAVVQLVEHQIVALVVVDSSSTGHPIIKADTAIFYFYKTLIFGLRESLINICLVCKIIQEETEMEIMNLENRINLLTNRDPIGNMRIINKLKRRLRKLKNNA